jgi:hypothetical protein
MCAERLTEIQYENRVLLRKMLQIDLKQQKKVLVQPKPEGNPTALNQYNSLNRKVRICDLTRIVGDNK